MIVLTAESTAEDESWTVSCDGCGDTLDPGEHDGPWTTQTAAGRAAETRGWWTWGSDYCPPCKARPLGGAE